MTDDRNRRSGRTAVDEPPWLRPVREAIDGKVLVDVRVAEVEEAGELGYDFLLVHPKGVTRYQAIDRFVAAIQQLDPDDIPPYIVLSVDEERASAPWYADYVSVRR